MQLKLIQDFDDTVLRPTSFSLHKINIKVQVPVIKLVDDMLVDDNAQSFCINQETGIRIGFAFYRNKQLVIVAVPIIVSTFSKDLIIFCLTP